MKTRLRSFRTTLAPTTACGLLLAAFVAMPAQAALIRKAGGAVSQDTFIQIYGIAPTADFVPGSDLLSIFSGAVEMSVSSREPMVFATPKGQCFGSVQIPLPPIPAGGGEPDFTGWEPVETHTACTYQYAQGAAIQLEGSFENYLEGAVLDIVWRISGNGISLVWDTEDVRVERSGGTGTVYLDALLPADMPVGDYAISMAFTQTAPEGWRLYNRGAPSYAGVQGGCIDDADPASCGTAVSPMASWSITGPRLRDTAGFRVVESVAEVPLPGTAGLFGLGMAALLLSRTRSRRQA